MTTDERIEALTQSVELLAQMHADHEQRMNKLEQMMERIVTVPGHDGAC